MQQSKIPWCTHVWNPVTGCTACSPGCLNCYAAAMTRRFAKQWGCSADEPFRVAIHEDRLDEPRKRKRPGLVFVCSMGDLFHEAVPFDFIDRIFVVILLATQHTFLVLTKRPRRMAEYFDDAQFRLAKRIHGARRWNCERPWPPFNVYLGVTVCNQTEVDEKIPILLSIPAAGRFVSVEPMLGEISLPAVCRTMRGTCWCGSHRSTVDCSPVERERWPVDWVIAGGETGPGARWADPTWIDGVYRQCQAAGVPFFFKQWGTGIGKRMRDLANYSHVETCRQMPDLFSGVDEPEQKAAV